MKRTKFLAMILVVSVMMMGAGYAYWSDTLTINNTVSTGEFNVRFLNNEQGYPKIFSWSGPDGQYIRKGYFVENEEGVLEETLQIETMDENTTRVQVRNMYPGSYARYETKIVNEGTIPAVFDYAKIIYNEGHTEGFEEVLKAELSFTKYKANGDKYTSGEVGYAGLTTAYYKLSQFEDVLNQKLAGLRLEPGEAISFDVPEELFAQYAEYNAAEGIIVSPDDEVGCIAFVIPSQVGNTNPDEWERTMADFSIQINWKQHNAPLTPVADR